MMNIWKCLLLTVVTRIAFVSTTTGCNEDFHHKNGPRIFPCVKEITLKMGQNFTLRCQGKTELKFKQQETPEEFTGDFNISERNIKSDNPEYKYEVALDLINVDRYAIGYYACMDVSMKESITLNSLIMEPNNTEYISYIYVYVDGTGSLLAPMREFITCKSNYYIVECRPTTSDVKVSLINLSNNKPPKNKSYSPKIGFTMKSLSNSAYECCGQRGNDNINCNKTIKIRNFLLNQQNLSQPIIIGSTKEYLQGETLTLNCTVKYTSNSALELTWRYPNSFKNGIIETSNKDASVVSVDLLYNTITITNASKEHEGKYICVGSNSCAQKSTQYTITYLEKPYLNLNKGNKAEVIEYKLNNLALSVDVLSYPPANFTFLKNNVPVKSLPNSNHYEEKFKKFSSEAILRINNATVEDSANYTLVARNGYLYNTTNFDVRIRSAPRIDFGKKDDQAYCVQGMSASYQCVVTGYPLPQVKWIFNGRDLPKGDSIRLEPKSVYIIVTYLDIKNCVSGNLTCWAQNAEGETNTTKKLLIYELVDGFGINRQKNDPVQWYPENQDVTITCLASKYKFHNVTWLIDRDDSNISVEYSENQFSLVAKLKIHKISLNDAGDYVCSGVNIDGTVKNDNINIRVAAREEAIIVMQYPDKEVYPRQEVHLSCKVQGVPRPNIEWYKDDLLLVNVSNVEMVTEPLDHKTMNSSITIYRMQLENSGTYKCMAISDGKEVSQAFELNVISEPAITQYLILIGVIIVIFILLVIYLTWRDKKRKQRFKKELAKAGLLYFKKGATRSLNPELGIDEQAELLPYDERFEFSPDKLNLGKQLGAGAFGVVYKAEARGIIDAEETTIVAVKMVKKTADNMYIKALASELKIMIHLGKHINIVNLLGACTRNVVKRELVVIVEYCKFGNIHNYMQRHREVFIDQLSDNTKENNLGKVNIGFSHSGSTGVQSEYFGSVNTQDTFLNSANTNRPRQNVASQPTEVVKASESYIQPEWRSNYDGDYSYEGRSARPLLSRDLVSWAFQIARGMEYLASRKVLHGDLAARNVLLADDNIVKICDFGLARSMYKNDEYKKKENSPLPVKWLAIECMTDQIFSTQSDVWSFGVVLWELFTLAKTPYPNISPADILRYLLEGHRLDKPQYADDKLYNLMKRCWEQKPTARPSFSQLQEILDSYLEDSVRNHYVHLSSGYMDSRPVEQEDYLAMVCAPDYNNMITPSPHHYVNNTKSFFPNTPTKVDEAGYQQMSSVSDSGIHSPKPVSTKFDFNGRELNMKVSEESNGGSELTPMLTLNKLPRSGSDSDQEGPVSPFFHAPCPRIDEDEVFEEKQQRNAQNSAVTNPTYITFNIDDEKKPLSVTNYVNIPNGLVK